MDSTLRRDVRLLKGYFLVMSTVLAVLALVAARGSDAKRHFGEIDVERMNVVEKDGTRRLIFSNKARFPGAILHGREYPHPRNVAGMLWFNEEGTENGGLGASGHRGPNGPEAASELMFDQYEQDQTVGLEYTERDGRRLAGLHVWDRPDRPIEPDFQRLAAARAMPEGPERERTIAALRAQGGGVTRLFVGKTPDRASTLALSDAQGRVRLRLSVDSLGVARIEVLDETGKVSTVVPAK